MENDHRAAEFRRNPKLEKTLDELNELLSVCQDLVNQQYEKPRFPILLVMGAPRSGSTLFLQWLAESKCWGYPSNLISRFFRAPYIGARVQQALIENDDQYEISGFQQTNPFASSLGKTKGVLAPNEFWYFWRRFFHFEEVNVLSREALDRIDVVSLNRELAALEAALEKPLAMKGGLMNWHVAFLDAIFDKVLFVHAKRDPAYTVQSLLESRQKFFGTEEMWYSIKPPEYRWLKNLDPISQVAGQVYFTRKAVEASFDQVIESRKLVVDYEQFCDNPAAVWETLLSKMAAQGSPFDWPYAGPRQFETTNHVRVSPERWMSIQEALFAIRQMDAR